MFCTCIQFCSVSLRPMSADWRSCHQTKFVNAQFFLFLIFCCQASFRPRYGFPLVLYLCVVGLKVTKASCCVMGISKISVLELLTPPLDVIFSVQGVDCSSEGLQESTLLSRNCSVCSGVKKKKKLLTISPFYLISTICNHEARICFYEGISYRCST